MTGTPLVLLVSVLVLVLVPGHGPPTAAALRCYACAPVDTSQLGLTARLVLKRFPVCDDFDPSRPQERFIMNCPPPSLFVY